MADKTLTTQQPHIMLRLLLTALLSSLFISSPACHATDSIWLKNGDKITGTILIKVSDKVVIKTNYAGEIKVNWADIHSIDAEKPMEIMLIDGSLIRGKLKHSDDGQIILDNKTLEPVLTTELSEIEYVNPPKNLTGEGYVWSGNINLGSNFNSGNSDHRNFQVNGESIIRGLENRYTLQGYAYISEDNDKQSQQNARMRNQFDHFFEKHWYGYFKDTIEHDRFRELRLRNNLGLGSGYQFFEGEKLNLSFEGGVSWLHHSFYQAQSEDYFGLHWAMNYNQYLFDSFVQGFHRHDTLIANGANSEVLFYSQSGFRFPFIMGLSATTQLDYNYDSRPVDNLKKSDIRALFTLGYSWK